MITDTERLDWILKNGKIKLWDTYNKDYLSMKQTRNQIDEHIRSERRSLPPIIIRFDDGAEFVLNENTGRYALKSINNGGNLISEYTYECLMEDERNIGKFKVADGTEDLEAMKQRWFKSFKDNNDGHGNE